MSVKLRTANKRNGVTCIFHFTFRFMPNNVILQTRKQEIHMQTQIQAPALVPTFDELMLFALVQADKEKRRKALKRTADDRRKYWEEDGE